MNADTETLKNLFRTIYERNEQLGEDQFLERGSIPENILMIDQATRKPLSPQMVALYEFGTKWDRGLFGMDLADPKSLLVKYQEEWLAQSISLMAENYLPLPPSDPSDAERTALLASEASGLGLLLMWWRSDTHLEPAIVSAEGGSIRVFGNIEEMARFLALGDTPVDGEKIYDALEQERGTLSS